MTTLKASLGGGSSFDVRSLKGVSPINLEGNRGRAVSVTLHKALGSASVRWGEDRATCSPCKQTVFVCSLGNFCSLGVAPKLGFPESICKRSSDVAELDFADVVCFVQGVVTCNILQYRCVRAFAVLVGNEVMISFQGNALFDLSSTSNSSSAGVYRGRNSVFEFSGFEVLLGAIRR